LGLPRRGAARAAGPQRPRALSGALHREGLGGPLPFPLSIAALGGTRMSKASPLSLFKGRRVFITGDTGFKGAWLALWLHDLGAKVSGYALPPKTGRDLYVRLGLKKLIRHQDGDIRDARRLAQAVR